MSATGRWSLPAGWQWASANEFANVVGGGTPKNAKDETNYVRHGVPWLTPADLSGYSSTYIERGARDLSEKGFASCSARMLPRGSVLMSSRAPVGYCVVAANVICTNQGFKSFALQSDQLVPEFLRYYLIGSKRYLESEASGTTFLELSGSRTEQLQFPLAPANEQRLIVSKIDELFSRIDEGEQALGRVAKLVERYRQSVLKAAVTGELTRDWREARKQAGEPVESGAALLDRILKARRAAWEQAELAKLKAKGKTPADDRWKQKYKEPAPPDTTDLPELPKGWVWTSLPTVCTDDTCNGISIKGSDHPPGTPALRLDAMTSDGFDYDARRYIRLDKHKAAKLAIIEGDFFVSRANGSLSLVGRAVAAQKPPALFVFPDTMIRYRPLRGVVSGGWLTSVWASVFMRRQLEMRAKTTAGIYKVSQQDIAGIAIPICSESEQQQVVDRTCGAIDAVANAASVCVVESKRSSALRQSILKAAFSGQLVPQDPHDEPASKLLERIAAERMAAPAKPRRGQRARTAPA